MAPPWEAPQYTDHCGGDAPRHTIGCSARGRDQPTIRHLRSRMQPISATEDRETSAKLSACMNFVTTSAGKCRVVTRHLGGLLLVMQSRRRIMTVSSDEWIASWESRRKRGALYFLLQWVLGVTFAFILYNAIHWLLGDRPFEITMVLSRAVLIGLGVGACVWITSQSRYQKHSGAKSASDA